MTTKSGKNVEAICALPVGKWKIMMSNVSRCTECSKDNFLGNYYLWFKKKQSVGKICSAFPYT